MKTNKLLTQCLVISFGLHATALWIFYAQPLLLKPFLTTVLGKNAPLVVIPVEEEDINLSEKNIALTEVFNNVVILPPQVHKPFDFEKAVSLSALQPKLEPYKERAKSVIVGNLPEEKFIAESVSIPTENLVISNFTFDESLKQNQLPREKAPLVYETTPQVAYLEEISKSLSIIPLELNAFPIADLYYPPISEELIIPLKLPSLKTTEMPQPTLETSQSLAYAKTEETAAEKPLFFQEPKHATFGALQPLPRQSFLHRRSQLPELAAYGFPYSASPADWNENFFVEVRTVKKEEGGYLFSLTFLPKYDMSAQRMKQTYSFLIDRSNSVDKHRYQTFKRATLKALQSLQEGDAFNVILFDSQFSQLSKTPLPYSKKSLKLAEEFLENQPQGSYFATTDLYQVLPTLIPASSADDEANVAILITDGDSSLHPEKQRKLIHSWLEQNQGKVSLYTACVGQGVNKPLLELLSRFSRGKMLYSDTHTAFPRKLAKLTLTLRNPIAKEMTLSIVKAQEGCHLKLFPPSSSLPLLFSDQPYEIFGEIDELSDFTLLLEGKNKNELLTLKKTISFADSKSDAKYVQTGWKQYQNYQHYETFLKNGKLSALKHLHE